MNTCSVVRSSRPAGLFSFGLLDGLQVRLRRPHLRAAPAGFGLERLATASMKNPAGKRLKQPPSFVLASLRGSMYPQGYASLPRIAAALLDELFEQLVSGCNPLARLRGFFLGTNDGASLLREQRVIRTARPVPAARRSYRRGAGRSSYVAHP